jgi:hypothetical protein
MEWWEYYITQGFGPTGEQLDGGYAGYAHFNKGIDFGVPLGTPIRSIISGTVISAGDSGDGWGTSVKIQDAQGNTHNFGHLSAAQVSPGQTILAGQLVGVSGSTGKSTGPHLSYDVWDASGNFFDPSQYISAAPGAVMQVDPEDGFLADPGGAAPSAPGGNTGTLTQVSSNGMPPGAQPTGDGGYTVWDAAVGKFAVYKPWYDSFTGETSAPRFVGYETPGTGSPYATQAPGTGTFVATQFNPETGQNHRVVIDERTGRVVQWGDPVPQEPKEPSTRYYSIGGAASPGAPASSGLSAPSGKPAANQWDSVAVANAITGGQGGQSFSQVDAKGYIPKSQDILARNISANQYGNNEMILRTYGIDTSKPEWQDPLAVAAAAATLGARQKTLVDQGYDPTFAASLIQYENNAKIADPVSQPLNMQSPYGQGQGIIAGNQIDPRTGGSAHTYSAEFARQYPHLVV